MMEDINSCLMYDRHVKYAKYTVGHSTFNRIYSLYKYINFWNIVFQGLSISRSRCY
jgi:DNA-directed RNA polymerase subunit L